MKEREKNSTSQTIDVEYTEDDIQEMREESVSGDELPLVGVHQFRRSPFVIKRSEQKIKISLDVDADVLDFFKDRATQTDSETFETQINNELRTAMERSQMPTDVVTLKMLDNPKFLSSLAEKLKKVA